MLQRLKREKKPVTLSPEEQAAFERGLKSEATGKDYSLAECLDFIRKQEQEWLKIKVSA